MAKARMPRGPIEPLPFTIKVESEDSFSFSHGIKSTQVTVTGLLHFGGAMVLVEWAELQSTQSVGFHGVVAEKNTLPLELVEVPIHWIGEVRLLRPFRFLLELRGRRLDAFEGVPTKVPGMLRLRVARRHWRLARIMAAAIEAARTDPELLAQSEQPAQLTGDRWTPLPR